MKILTDKPYKDFDNFERILDTETGLVYERSLGHPSGLTFEEAENERRTFTVVDVYSLHGATNDYGEYQSIKYEAEAADRLWQALREDNATQAPPALASITGHFEDL